MHKIVSAVIAAFFALTVCAQSASNQPLTGSVPATQITGLGSAALQSSGAFDAAGTATALGSSLKAVKGATQSRFFDKVPMLWSRNRWNSSLVTNYGTYRLMVQAPYAMHDPQVVFRSYNGAVAPEGTGANAYPYTVTAVFEYPPGTFYPLTIAGQKSYTLQPGGEIKTDEFALDLPVGADAWVRDYIQLSLAPTSPTATAGTGGSLAAATYYYKITQVAGTQGESGGSTEVSAVVSANGTAALNWTFNANSVANTAVNIYRGPTSGSEKLLVTLPANTTSWTDTGALTPGTISVPSAQTMVLGTAIDNVVRVGEAGNDTFSGGNGSNQLTTSGTAWSQSGAYLALGFDAVLATPDQGYDVPIGFIFGDSIGYGYQDHIDRGYIALAFLNANISYFTGAIRNDTATNANGSGAAMRLGYAQAATDCVDEYGINDLIIGGFNLAQLQTAEITDWGRLKKRCLRVWANTLTPNATSTDSFATAGNQTPNTDYSETARTGYNDWLRQGAPVLISGTTITATTNGTANAVYVGQSGHPLSGYFDPCTAIEVNSSNVPTLDGGRWLSNGTANNYTPDGLHPGPNAVVLEAATITTAKFTEP